MSNVSTRRVGDAEVNMVHAGNVHWDPPFPTEVPWATDDTPCAEDGRAIIGINGLLVRDGDALLLVDPNSFGPDDDMGEALLVPGPSIADVLDELGVGPEDVTHVLITHGHADHFSAVLGDNGTPRFPNAKHYFPKQDWAPFVVDHPEYGGARLLTPVDEAGLLEQYDGEVQVSDSVSLVSAPGETPGHHVVRVASGGSSHVHMGDLFHFPVEFSNLEWAPATASNPELLPASREAVLALLQDDATCSFTHGRFPAWGRPEQGPDGSQRWSYDEPAR